MVEVGERAMTAQGSDFLLANVSFGALGLMGALASGVGAVAPAAGVLAEACERALEVLRPFPDGTPVRQVAEVTPWFAPALTGAGARVTPCCGRHYLSLPGATPDDVTGYAPVLDALAAIAGER